MTEGYATANEKNDLNTIGAFLIVLTTDLRLLFVQRSYSEIFVKLRKLFLVTYYSQNSKIKKISQLKNLVNFQSL